jgi:hypothetical protein
MTTLTKSDIKDIKDLIVALREDIKRLEIGQAEIKTKVEGLEKRVDDINSRLNIMTIGFLSIVGVTMTGILGIIGKIVFFSNP